MRERVEEIIAELDLTKCANTRVGQVGKGLSGGETDREFITLELRADAVFIAQASAVVWPSASSC